MSLSEPNNESTQTTANAARKRGWFWPGLIVGFLLFQVGLCAIGVYLATSSQSFAVESDYYNKALHWDESAAEQQSSNALGWQTALFVADTAGSDAVLGKRIVTLTLKDRAGAPLDGASVKLLCFAHARAKDAQQASLKPAGGGAYSATLPMPRDGLWEFRMIASRGADTHVETVQRELAALGQGVAH